MSTENSGSTRPARTMQIVFGVLTLLSVVGLLAVPSAEATPIFLAGYFALFSTFTLQRVLRRSGESGSFPTRAVIPSLVLNFAASALLGYLAGTAIRDVLVG